MITRSFHADTAASDGGRHQTGWMPEYINPLGSYC
jgi:hypothetical protein